MYNWIITVTPLELQLTTDDLILGFNL